ncbi:hypothetical protein [Tenacibaculum ascidiaceicola]|uniref:hypothetical protein n=1 Tax=Tenacibaculum ascidiaceicola TaxID=1699411 RepID=UPI0038965D81
MKQLTIIVILCSLNFSCKKNIEINKDEIFIKGGIKSELVIMKIINNDHNDDYTNFPFHYYVKEKARLKIKGYGITFQYENGEKKYFLNQKPLKLNDRLNFHKKNKYYHWELEKPSDKKEYEIFPFNFEKNHWYKIRDISFRGANCYFSFFINDKGEFVYDDIEYITLSPI